MRKWSKQTSWYRRGPPLTGCLSRCCRSRSLQWRSLQPLLQRVTLTLKHTCLTPVTCRISPLQVRKTSSILKKMFKPFLQQTKGIKGLNIGKYFPDKLLFLNSARHIVKNKARSDRTNEEIFRLKKHDKSKKRS